MQVPSQFSHEVRLPWGEDLPPDEEWCEVVIGDEVRRIRFHDYADIYKIAGLYEHLFRDRLGCSSPAIVVSLLRQTLQEKRILPASLRVLDVGAGNGLVGEELRRLGVGKLVGVDILQEAAAAAERDRPDIYDRYCVVDLDDRAATARALAGHRFNCVVAVASLGFAGVSPSALVEALSYLASPRLVALNVSELFLLESDKTGFRELLTRDGADRVLEPHLERRYRHRLSISGNPLYYVAYIASAASPAAALK